MKSRILFVIVIGISFYIGSQNADELVQIEGGVPGIDYIIDTPQKYKRIFPSNIPIHFASTYQDLNLKLNPISFIRYDTINEVMLFNFESLKSLKELLFFEKKRSKEVFVLLGDSFQSYRIHNREIRYYEERINSKKVEVINIAYDSKSTPEFINDDLLYIEDLNLLKVNFNKNEKSIVELDDERTWFLRRPKISIAILKNNQDIFVFLIGSQECKNNKFLLSEIIENSYKNKI